MAVELVMPRLSESMEEGTVVSWLVPDGAPVARGQEIAEIETDKATLPYEAPESGVLRILVPEGSTLALGQPIGLIDDLSPLPGGHSVPPPGVGSAAAGGQVPGPRAPDEDPPTASYEIQPGQHGAHTVHASSPPPAGGPASPDAEWSPAWGPQPTGRPAAGAPLDDLGEEGETTEFEVIDPGQGHEPEPAWATPTHHVVQNAPAPAPVPEPVAAVPAAAPAAEPAAAPVPASTASPAQPPLPWVDPSFSPKPSTAAAIGAPGAAEAPALEQVAAAQAAASGDDGRLTADQLVGPATLPPRPPVLRPAPGIGQSRIPASPVARRLARELGIDLSTIPGTGPEGRVVRADIEAAQATGAARPPRQAGAAPAVASEFTPPVDEERAAAPIPDVEPGEPEPVAAIPAEAEPAIVGEPEANPVAEQPSEPTEAPAPLADDAGAANADPIQPELSQPPATPDAPMIDPDAAALEAAAALAAATGADLASAGDPVDLEVLDVESDLPPSDAVDTPAPATEAPEAPMPDPTTTSAAPEAAGTEAPVAAPEAVTPDPSKPAPRGKGDPVVVELTRQQQTVARRMAESKATIPDFHTMMEIDAGPLVALRADLKANRPDLRAPSVNDWLVKATAVALRAFPSLNGGYRDGRIEQYPKINIGVAVDAGGTLLVPVVHDADQLSVGQIAARTGELVGKSRDGSLRPPDIASATFTISNLGTFGVDQFTAVITPGQAAILTAGAIADRPVARERQLVLAPTMRLTLTADHRAIYGAEAARFLARVRQLLEHPTSLLA